ncbi:uridylate kinase, putative [Babesia ovis]|uniref:Uridylate kinase, putative n=1 Tax=Babesia ovis TaxID=5869 RepID=A0A9W5WW18_BABOV|nr:uridylate kinase, putative [Babesia ovis]
MSKSLASFLDRRKKNTVKAAALLQQTEEAARLKQNALDGVDDTATEQPSEDDDEWKVSDDEESKAFKSQADFSGSLMKSVRTVAGEGLEDGLKRQESKPSQHVWQTITEPVEPKEKTQDEASKKWMPKYKSGSFGGGLLTKNDVDLAEAVRVAEAKAEAAAARKNKAVKKKEPSPRPAPAADVDDPSNYVKIKFNIFTVVDETYRSFKAPHPSTSLDTESVKAKYIARSAAV